MEVSEGDHIILYPKKHTDIYAMAETTSIYFIFKYLGHKSVNIRRRLSIFQKEL